MKYPHSFSNLLDPIFIISSATKKEVNNQANVLKVADEMNTTINYSSIKWLRFIYSGTYLRILS